MNNLYSRSINRLFQLRAKPTREHSAMRMQRFLQKLGNPQLQFPAVHIAGTNGKGSVAHKIYSGLYHSKVKVGLFTSPHLFDFRERIVVNNQGIPEDEVLRLVQVIDETLQEKLIFFEYATLIAFLYFANEKIDVAVVEAGIGGKYDSTNVVNSILCIITSIGYDHQNLLGTTLSSIAEHKAGILKEGIPAILGENAVQPEILCKAPNALIAKKSKTPNREIARLALQHLEKRFLLKQEDIHFGIKQELLGRTQQVGGILLDGAHNQTALKRLLGQFAKEDVRIILAISIHRDPKVALETILQATNKIAFVEHQNPTLQSVECLKKALDKQVDCLLVDSYSRLFEEHMLYPKEKWIACGSLYQVQEVLRAYDLKNLEDESIHMHQKLLISILEQEKASL